MACLPLLHWYTSGRYRRLWRPTGISRQLFSFENFLAYSLTKAARAGDVLAPLASSAKRGGCAARSAAEKFLFRFLDGLPKTKGLFTPNGRIDIPFGPNSYMEVDLLCKEKKVAVEIDGAFHFEDAEHYRRDRRKDFLLQKNGYLVLRFLAEDVTKRLPQVVEEISAALACRGA